MDLFAFLRSKGLRFLSQHPASPMLIPTGHGQQKPSIDPLPGRELIFTLIREHLMMQHQVADQQDAKASGILIGGTTMIGFAFLIQHRPMGNCASLIPLWLHHWPIIMRLALPYVPFLICYIFAMIFALQASRIRGYWAIPDPVVALSRMNIPEQDLKVSLSQSMAHFAKENEKTLDRKALWLRWAARLLLGETIALVILLFYQTIC